MITSELNAPGELSANARIVAQMRPALVKYFTRKCGAVDQAEDLAQDVVLRALRSGVTWESAEQAKGYIFRSAVNRWRDHKRMALTHGVTVEWSDSAAQELGEVYANEERAPEHVLIVEQELNRVATALTRLGERTRDIFLLVRLEGMKQGAVAEMLGVSVSTVEKELVKALAHLARSAGRRDGAA